MPLTHWMIHSHASELLATFWTDKMSLLAGSLRNLPKFTTTPSVNPYLLKFTRSLSNLGFARLRTDAAHQSVSIFSVFSFFIFSLGVGSISKHRPCSVSLTAMGGLSMALSSVRLFLSSTSRAFYAAFNFGRASASYTSHSCLIELASLTASSTIRSYPEIWLMMMSASSFWILTISILTAVYDAAFLSSGFISYKVFFIFSTTSSVLTIFEYPFSYL
jgi:hypothetical protein